MGKQKHVSEATIEKDATALNVLRGDGSPQSIRKMEAIEARDPKALDQAEATIEEDGVVNGDLDDLSSDDDGDDEAATELV